MDTDEKKSGIFSGLPSMSLYNLLWVNLINWECGEYVCTLLSATLLFNAFLIQPVSHF